MKPGHCMECGVEYCRVTGTHQVVDCLNNLKRSVNDWKAIVKLVTEERDAALDALTVTQEEWLLRVKHLESENYKLSRAVDRAVEYLTT